MSRRSGGGRGSGNSGSRSSGGINRGSNSGGNRNSGSVSPTSSVNSNRSSGTSGSRNSGSSGRSSGSGGNRGFGSRSGDSGYSRSSVNTSNTASNNSTNQTNSSKSTNSSRTPIYHNTGPVSYNSGPYINPTPVIRQTNIYNTSGGSGGFGNSGRRSFFSGGSWGLLIMAIVFIVILVSCSIAVMGSGTTNYTTPSSITVSTIKREPLPAGSVTETDYYTDELGWIGNQTELTSGMKNFYKATGVQPYLYLTNTVDGTHYPTDAQMEVFANNVYDALFTDEAHLLLIFFEYGDSYYTWYLLGSQAKAVLDSEAMDILLDYIDKYYFDQNLSDEQFFSKAFNDAGETIMKVETSPWIPILIILGILAILIVVFFWWRSYKKQKNLEAEQTQKMLETPLETFGNTEAEERAKKYNDEN